MGRPEQFPPTGRPKERGSAPGDRMTAAAAPTARGLDDLRARIAALQTRFADVGARAAAAAADVAAGGAPPPEVLLAELAAAAQAFHLLRDDVLESVATLEVVLPMPSDALVSLR